MFLSITQPRMISTTGRYTRQGISFVVSFRWLCMGETPCRCVSVSLENEASARRSPVHLSVRPSVNPTVVHSLSPSRLNDAILEKNLETKRASKTFVGSYRYRFAGNKTID